MFLNRGLVVVQNSRNSRTLEWRSSSSEIGRANCTDDAIGHETAVFGLSASLLGAYSPVAVCLILLEFHIGRHITLRFLVYHETNFSA